MSIDDYPVVKFTGESGQNILLRVLENRVAVDYLDPSDGTIYVKNTVLSISRKMFSKITEIDLELKDFSRKNIPIRELDYGLKGILYRNKTDLCVISVKDIGLSWKNKD